ncbi:hypothetical protein GGR58DRAFT_516198 [Xylaria digitata]|nr:hypothetical protein GGR58DRAFT_516198 [Xylaria digitata]
MALFDAQEDEQRIRNLFTLNVLFWEYEKTPGNGAWGLAVLLRQKGVAEVDGRKADRIVLKVGINFGEGQLRNETAFLKHIVRLGGAVDNLNVSQSYNRFPPLGFAFDAVAGINGPVIALEYLDGGDCMWSFDRIQSHFARPPNRVLWSIFLCYRACIGMAYPANANLSTPLTLEEISPDREPGSMAHNDIAPRNIIIASGDGIGEHGIGHTFKLIDFGQASLAEDAGAKVSVSPSLDIYTNDLSFNYFMITFVTMSPGRSMRTVDYAGHETHAAAILPSPQAPNPYPWLYPQLAGVISRCQYRDARQRPELAKLLAQARNVVLHRTAGLYPNPEDETDDAIRDFCQRSVIGSLDTAIFYQI